jgi:hypothetical protein
MKALTSILFAAIFYTAAGQGGYDLTLTDEFDPRSGCETLSTRLDYLLASVSQDPESNAYVIIRKADNPVDNVVVYRSALAHARLRNYPVGRYAVLLTDGTGAIRVELWIGKNGKKPELRPVPLQLEFAASQARIPFVEDTIQLVTIDGRATYIPAGNPSCLYSLSSTFVSEFLRVNPAYDFEFRIQAESASRYRQVVSLLKDEFTKDGSPSERLRFVNAGSDPSLEGGGAKLSAVRTSFFKRSPAR